MKRIAVGILLLVVGIALGWLMRGATAGFAEMRRRTVVRAAVPAPALATAPVAANGPSRKRTEFTPTERVTNFAAFVKRGHTFFNVNAILGNKLDPAFIDMYGLSDAEAASLNASLAAASNRITEIAIGLATVQTDNDGKTLSVHVPPFPDAGGVVHDQVFAAFKATLGSERYAAFSILSADRVENAFTAFGLNDTTYVMKLTPGPGLKNDPAYVINVKYASATGVSGNSGSNLPASMIADNFPVLAHFVPPPLIPPKR